VSKVTSCDVCHTAYLFSPGAEGAPVPFGDGLDVCLDCCGVIVHNLGKVGFTIDRLREIHANLTVTLPGDSPEADKFVGDLHQGEEFPDAGDLPSPSLHVLEIGNAGNNSVEKRFFGTDEQARGYAHSHADIFPDAVYTHVLPSGKAYTGKKSNAGITWTPAPKA